MLHHGRSGSTVLSGQLSQHPGIYWDAELLRKPRVNQLNGQVFKDFSASAHVDICRFKSHRKWYGFELKPLHVKYLKLDYDAFLEDLVQMGFSHFVVLERRNTLRRIISARINWLSGKSHLKTGEARKLYSVPIPADSILERIRTEIGEMEHFRKSVETRNHLSLYYEDHIEQDPRVAYRMVCDFLGLDAVDVQLTLKKRNPFPVADMVDNFEEIREVLQHTEYAWMLEA